VIIGASKVSQIDDAVEVVHQAPLSDDEKQRIEDILKS